MQKDETLIKGEDFLIDGVYKSFTLKIASAEMADRKSEGGKMHGLLIHFEKAKKPFFAPEGQVNYRLIGSELGTQDPKKLIGKELTLIPVKGDWFGDKNTLALRVLVTGEKPKPKISAKVFGKSLVGFKVA